MGLSGNAKKEFLDKKIFTCAVCPLNLEVTYKAKGALNRHTKKDQAEVGDRLKELLHTATNGAFVPLMHCCLEECHVRKLCALKGIMKDELRQ